jgi:hydrogenase nickel incorporation protein HypA/HybF
MHEFSIASALMQQVLEAAKKNKIDRVQEVEIEVGALQLVVPEALEVAFEALAKDTPIQGARLVQKEKPILARCRGCDKAFSPELGLFTCPQCGKADVEIVAGRDIILLSLSGSAKNEGGDS